MNGKAPLSVVIITKDEAKNLPSCLASIRSADQVVVVDSRSPDDTVKIAPNLECDVFVGPGAGSDRRSSLPSINVNTDGYSFLIPMSGVPLRQPWLSAISSQRNREGRGQLQFSPEKLVLGLLCRPLSSAPLHLCHEPDCLNPSMLLVIALFLFLLLISIVRRFQGKEVNPQEKGAVFISGEMTAH